MPRLQRLPVRCHECPTATHGIRRDRGGSRAGHSDGAAAIRRRHRPAWWLAVGSQCADLVAIIVPLAGDPSEIGLAVLAVIPLVGLGLLFTRELRLGSASV